MFKAFSELSGPFAVIFHGHGAAAHVMRTPEEVWDYLFQEEGANFQEHSTAEQLSDELANEDNWHFDDAGNPHQCGVTLGEDSCVQIVLLTRKPGQTPFDRAIQVHRGDVDNQMPDFEELKQWLYRVPKTWLPALLKACVFSCTVSKLFKDDGLQRNVARWEAWAANPTSILRTEPSDS